MAPKGNKNAEGNHGGGRKSSYKPEYAEIARKACEIGYTDHELAELFEVSVRTIGYWRLEHPDFFAALKTGKDIADDRVERSLYQKAVGYKHEAVKIFMPAGASEPVYAPYIEHCAPDTTACIFWLKNRRQQQWRDVHKHEHGEPGAFDNIDGMSAEQLREYVANSTLPQPKPSPDKESDKTLN